MYRVSVFVTALAAASAFALPNATAQSAQEQVQQLQQDVSKLNDQLVDERSKLMRTLKVNGKQLDPLEVMRECVYLAGGKLHGCRARAHGGAGHHFRPQSRARQDQQ